MHTTIQKIFVIAIGVIAVFFLLFDGGAITDATIRGDMSANVAGIGQSWIWITPTLLIFGLGFLLAWLLLGEDEVPRAKRNALSEEVMETPSQGNT